MTEYDSWLPMNEVKQQTGMSERTIYRMVEEGKLRQAKRPIPGRKPLSVYDPDNVAELARLALRALPQVMLPDGGMAETAIVPVANALVEAIHIAAFRTSSELAELAHKTYLTIDEARRLTGLSERTIQRAAKDGAVKRMGRVYRRADLERL